MFTSLFSSTSHQPNASGTTTAAPTFGALPALGQPSTPQSQQDVHAVCTGVQQRMQAIQSMYSGSFLTFSYVLADSPSQIQQVYNAAFQQNVHHDAGKWHEAKVKNPDTQYAYPMPVHGLNALSERSKQQRAHLNNLIAATDNAKTQVSNLKSHTERVILTEISNCDRRNQQLSKQLAKLMLSIELFGLQNCKASVDYARHRELLEKVEKVSSAISVLQKRVSDLRAGQKEIESLGFQAAGPVAALPSISESGVPGFVSLKESVAKKTQSVYNAVLDRCRAVSAQAMHERLSNRSKDYLAELKREYISGGAHVDTKQQTLLKFRTMQSFELAITRTLSGALSKDIYSTVMEIASLAQTPSVLMDLWQVVAFACNARGGTMQSYLKASVEFLEAKFGEEITGVTDKVSRQLDKKTALYAYCRQRISIRSGDLSWIWFAVFSAFRAGWSSVLSEIALEKGHQVEGLDLVCQILAKIIEGVTVGSDRDPTKLNSILVAADSRPAEDAAAYRWLCVMICKNETDRVKISQELPDCNAFDWIWFGLRTVMASESKTGLAELRAKIDALPVDYFDSGRDPRQSGLYPLLSESLGGLTVDTKTTARPVRSIASSKSAIQLGLMQFLTLDFEKGLKTALKHPDEPFDINDPFHRGALYISICLDKFGLVEYMGDAGQIVLEAALTVAVVQERNSYAGAVSGNTGKKIIDQLARLDKRRDKVGTTAPSSPAGLNYPSLKGQ
jgi:hypothetical protein